MTPLSRLTRASRRLTRASRRARRSVPVASPTKEQLVRFYEFVIGVMRDVEQLSKLSLPEFLWIKWEARRTEAKKLAAMAADAASDAAAADH